MCTEGVCTHGSKDNRTHQNLFSRDSKVSIGTDRGRMCNIVSIVRSAPEAAGLLQSHRNGHLQSRPCTPTDGRSGTSTFRSADRASRDTSKSRSSENPRRKRRAPRPEPISARVATDLGAEVDRSRGGVRPISASGPSGSSGLSMPVRTRTLRQRPGHWLLQLQQTTTQGLSNRRRARVDAELGVGAQQVRLDGRLSDV